MVRLLEQQGSYISASCNVWIIVDQYGTKLISPQHFFTDFNTKFHPNTVY